MKKLSRRRARFAILAFWGGMALVIAGGCMSQFTVFELGLAAVVASWMIKQFGLRCPHCGYPGVLPRWKGKCGCIRCGCTVEFDD